MANKKEHLTSVGIKELKDRLRSYVKRVRHGNQASVTDPGEKVALLVPISRKRRVVKSLMESGIA